MDEGLKTLNRLRNIMIVIRHVIDDDSPAALANIAKVVQAS